MPDLFTPLTLREVSLRNRIMVSPMCQYSSVDGFANDWHLVHLGSRAVGGAGLVCSEATAVEPEGRISPHDLGIWDDRHVDMLARITRFIREHGAVPAIQLAHAGRKASRSRPWELRRLIPPEDGGWIPRSASGLPLDPDDPPPHAVTVEEIAGIVRAFAEAAVRAEAAGFEVVELHAAHGYLLHEFLSPLTNHRDDAYGGSFERRCRLLLEVVEAVRARWPERYPLFVRISTTDWVEGGWDVEASIALCRRLAPLGVDLIDCSSGGAVPQQQVPVGPGYQVPNAVRIRREVGIPVAAVGLITTPEQADTIIREGQADLVALAREELRNPYFPLHAALRLGVEIPWPHQYERGIPGWRGPS